VGPAAPPTRYPPVVYSRGHATAEHDHHDDPPTSGSALSSMAFSATLHCLTGCALGEITGMVIGTALGFHDAGTIVLAFLFGCTLTSLPLLRASLTLAVVVPVALAVDTLSIAMMEVIDNMIMVGVPGAMDAGLGDVLFWGSLSFALVAAGVAGTVAMTAVQTAVAKARGQEASTTPAEVAKRIIRGVFQGEVSEERTELFNNVMHWSYGTSWGRSTAWCKGPWAAARPSTERCSGWACGRPASWSCRPCSSPLRYGSTRRLSWGSKSATTSSTDLVQQRRTRSWTADHGHSQEGLPRRVDARYTAAPMNRLAPRALASVLVAVAVAVPVAGCGSNEEKAASPLDNALGFVPADSPLVISFQTDPRGGQFRAAKRIVEKFPFAAQIEQQLQNRLRSQSVDYQRDLKPLLGNEFVVGASNVQSIVDNNSNDKDFVGAIQAKDGKKLEQAVKKEKAKEDGEKDGAKIYKGKDGSPFAIKDDVLVVAGTRALLDKALANRGSGDRFTEEDFDKGTEGLPKDAAVRFFTDLQKVIAADPDTADARKVKWVKALRDFGLSASVVDDKVEVDFNLATDPKGLTEDDLPLAAGGQSPEVIKQAGRIGFGLRDLGQIVKFGESAAQATDPAQFGSYEQTKAQVERQLDIDIQKDVLDQLDGDASISATPEGDGPAAKVAVKDPGAFKATLAKVTKALPAIIRNSSGTTPKIKRSGGLYSATTATGKIAYGMVGDSFVLSDTAAAARMIASAPTERVPGGKGSVAIQADAEGLVKRALSRLSGSQLGGQKAGLAAVLGGALFTGPLGDLTGSAEAETDGVSGKVSLGFD